MAVTQSTYASCIYLCMPGITQYTVCHSRKPIFTLLSTRWKALCNQLAYPLAADKRGLQTLPPCLRNHYVTLHRQQRQITDVLRAKNCLPWRLSTPSHMQGAILALLPISPISTSQPLSPSAPTSVGSKWPQRGIASFPAARHCVSTGLLRLLRIKHTKKYFQLSQGHNIQYLAVSRPFSDPG